jgi:hypothetical protein
MSKPKLNALIIGAGGVTSYMLPALKNSFDLEANIIDGDKLEKKNLDRQLFRNNMVGEYKAKALMRQYNFKQKDGQAICQYFDKGMLETPYRIFKSGSPISCQGDALESTPQLAIANQMAATFGNYLVWSWFGMPHKPDMIDYKPVEFQSTFSKMQTKTMEDFKYVAEVRS